MDKKKEAKRAIKFLVSDLLGAGIQVGVFAIFQEFVFHDSNEPYGWSYLVSVAFSVIWTFTFNRSFTFKSHNNLPIAILKVLAYYLVVTPLIIWGGTALVGAGWNEYLTCGISMAANYIPKYFYYRIVVFGGSLDTNFYARWRENQKKEKLAKQQAQQQENLEDSSPNEQENQDE